VCNKLAVFIGSSAVCRVFTGAIVGIIIRYGLDAKKHLFVLDCLQHNVSKSPESELPTSVVINYNYKYNSTEYFEYTNGRKVGKDYVGQPQFENKVVLTIAMVFFFIRIMCDYYFLLRNFSVMILTIYVCADFLIL